MRCVTNPYSLTVSTPFRPTSNIAGVHKVDKLSSEGGCVAMQHATGARHPVLGCVFIRPNKPLQEPTAREGGVFSQAVPKRCQWKIDVRIRASSRGQNGSDAGPKSFAWGRSNIDGVQHRSWCQVWSFAELWFLTCWLPERKLTSRVRLGLSAWQSWAALAAQMAQTHRIVKFDLEGHLWT